MFKAHQILSGNWAVVRPDGTTFVIVPDEFTARQCAVEMNNRWNYTPPVSPYAFAESGCGRWDRQVLK